MHRNIVYGHSEWETHKCCWRHCRHFFTILASGVNAISLGPPVFTCTLIAILVAGFNQAVVDRRFPHWVPLLRVAPLPFELTSPVVALLLVFRTNASYGRFDEARKAWGSNVNRTRDLARQVLSWIRSPGDAGKVDCLLRHIKAYSYCLKHHLTQENTLREDLKGVLEHREVEAVMASKHSPNYVLQVISELINQSELSQWEKIRMDENITQFHDNVGACERIFKTPIPISYTRVTSRILLIWHMTLPLALWESCDWLMIPVTFLSALAMFYIEEVGVMIEEPFCILALKAISDGVAESLDGLVCSHREASFRWSCCSFQPIIKEDSHVAVMIHSANNSKSEMTQKVQLQPDHSS